MNDRINISDSRFFDPISMPDISRVPGVLHHVGAAAGMEGLRVVARESSGQRPGHRRDVCRPACATDSRDALKAAIKAYAYAYRIGAAHDIERTWAACMAAMEACNA